MWDPMNPAPPVTSQVGSAVDMNERAGPRVGGS
jgi:hypothetical protein